MAEITDDNKNAVGGTGNASIGIAKMVAGWPQNFTADRAKALGFQAESNFTEIITSYITEDMHRVRTH